jgi:ubiquinol-cytochrome c reductase cytochrome b subunit
LLRGDSLVSGSTLSRQFALHVVLLPWLLFVLLGLHFTLIRRHGITPLPGRETSEPGVRFYPVHLMRSLMTAAVTLAVVITLATWFTRPVGPPADPGTVPRDLISTWVVVDIGRTLGHFLGGWGVALFVFLGVVLALLPLFDRGPARRLRERPAVLAAGIVFFALTLLAWGVGRTLQSQGPVPHAAPAETPGPAVPFGGAEGGVTPLPPDTTDATAAGGPR